MVADNLSRQAAYFTMEANQSFTKPPLNFNVGLAQLGLASLVK